MKTATISSAKNRLSSLIALVRKGETVVITDREQPVALLAPVPSQAEGDGSRIAHLERSGLVRRARVEPAKTLARRLSPMPASEADLLAALLADRDQGR